MKAWAWLRQRMDSPLLVLIGRELGRSSGRTFIVLRTVAAILIFMFFCFTGFALYFLRAPFESVAAEIHNLLRLCLFAQAGIILFAIPVASGMLAREKEE
ncbi:MAG: hypothetical protein KJ052_13200, partial [Candidatus Hydrogenedentes bacterium]|nr:hypothetical protein [Candidatus Hydrogenedentota bacterium]